MSSYADEVLKSLNDGTYEDKFGKGAKQPVVSTTSAPILPDDFDAVDAEEARPILGNVAGIGAEIFTGLYLTKRFHRSQQFLKWARGAKAVSVGAVVTPEPSSTIAGLGALALSEAAIWGASNVLGQHIRKAYGVQDNVSAGEVLASSVFGVGLISKAGQKLVSLGDGLAQMKAWGKGNELFINGTKSFVSGATLGIAETALRQEVQLLLDERENRDIMEYLIGGAAGGGFNTMFDVFSRTGKWGQAKAKEVTANAKKRLEEQAVEFETRAENTKDRRAARSLRQQAKKARSAIELTDDLGQQLEAASENLNKAPKKVEPSLTPKKDYEIESILDEFGEVDFDADEALRKIAKERDLGITSDREANTVVRNDDGEVIGGTFVSNDGDNYTFDVVVSEAAEGTGVGSKLLDDVIEMPYDLQEINPNATMQVDVVSPKMKEMLERRGFEVKEEIGIDRWLMEPKDYDNVGKPKEIEPSPAPKKPEAESPRRARITELSEELEGLNRETMSRKKPRIEREAKVLYNDIQDEIGVNVRKLRKEHDPDAQDKLLELVQDLRYLNTEVKDVVETTTGRTLQAARGDASKRSWTDKYSLRSQREDAQLALLEDTLSRGMKDVEAPTPPKTDKEEFRQKSEVEKPPSKAELDEKEYLRFRAQLMTDIENAFNKSLETDSASLVTKSFRWVAQSRQLALINQLPSVLASLPTGVIAMNREINRSVANYVANKHAGNELAGELASVDLKESLANFQALFSKDTAKAVGRTVKENQSATDPRRTGRMEEDLQQTLPRGEAALVARARRRAVKAAKAKDALVERAAAETPLEQLNNIYFAAQSAGVRLIQGVDEGFKRTLIFGRIRAASRKEAIMELVENKRSNGVNYTPEDVDALAKAKYDKAFIEVDGLMTLRANHEYLEEVDLIRRELLFAANSDNISEVVAPISEKVVQGIKSVTGTDHPFSFLVNAIMPYIGVPIRGVSKGIEWMGAPIRIAGLGTGNVMLNPYVSKIKAATKELENFEALTKQRGDSTFDEKGLEAINTIDGAKNEILERIERLDARRIQYNADTLADAFMALELIGVVAAAAWAGNATGSLTFLSDDQKKKAQLTGTQPFKFFGMDYKAVGPAAMPMAVAGDLSGYFKIRKIEAQTGEVILDEDMTWIDVIVNSMVTMGADQPLSTGVKSITEILGSDEQRKVAASSMLASYAPVPAQARKAVQQFLNDGRVADLQGSSFKDRLLYQSLGMGMSQYKTDYFGYDIEEPKSAIQINVMRQWPDAKRLRTEFENILRSDTSAIIQDKPKNLRTGIRMKDYVDHRGVTLSYHFDQRLKETKIKGKTLVDAVDAKIFDNNWMRKYDRGAQMNDKGELVNQGLLELNKLMREYYDKTRQTIIKDKSITSSFINKNNETLLDELERFDKGDFFRSQGPINFGDLLDN